MRRALLLPLLAVVLLLVGPAAASPLEREAPRAMAGPAPVSLSPEPVRAPAPAGSRDDQGASPASVPVDVPAVLPAVLPAPAVAGGAVSAPVQGPRSAVEPVAAATPGPAVVAGRTVPAGRSAAAAAARTVDVGRAARRPAPAASFVPTPTTATTQLLDGPQGYGFVDGSASPLELGEIVAPDFSVVAVTVLATTGDPELVIGGIDVDPTVGPPLLVQLGQSPTRVSVYGAYGTSLRLSVRTVRKGTAGTRVVHLQGAGDVVAVPFDHPDGVGSALRLSATGGRGAASLLVDPRLPLRGSVQVAPGGVAQGLPVGVTSGTVYVWAPDPDDPGSKVDLQATVDVVPAVGVGVPDGTTVHVVEPVGTPVLLRVTASWDHPASYTPLAEASGSVRSPSAPVGTGSRPTYVSDGAWPSVASFSGAGAWGPPVGVDVTVHAEAVRSLAQASTTALHPLTADAPGLVYDVTAADLTQTDTWTLDVGSATSVPVDACFVGNDDGRVHCQTYPPGATTSGSFLVRNGRDVLVVLPDPGTVTLRLVKELVDAPSVTVRGTHGTGPSTSQVTLAGYRSSLGRLVEVSCSVTSRLVPVVGYENTSDRPTTITSIDVAGATDFVADFPARVTSNPSSYGGADVHVAAFDGVDDEAGASGGQAAPLIGATLTDYRYAAQPFAAVLDRDLTVTLTIPATTTSLYGVGLRTGPDTTYGVLTAACAYGYFPPVS